MSRERSRRQIEAGAAMMEHAEDMIVRNLIEALNRLREDLDRVELWTGALAHFQHPAPDYRPDGEYLLPTKKAARPDL
jgi:hypothetical protein